MSIHPNVLKNIANPIIWKAIADISQISLKVTYKSSREYWVLMHTHNCADYDEQYNEDISQDDHGDHEDFADHDQDDHGDFNDHDVQDD